MAKYKHLILQKLVGELDRRKHGFGAASGREPKTHGAKIRDDVSRTIERHRERPAIGDVNPALILKVVTTGLVSEDEWSKLDLTVLAIEPDKTIVLFADDAELTKFKERIESYNGEKPEGQKAQPYAGLIEAIETVGELSPENRIGHILLSEGFTSGDAFRGDELTLDVELWPVADFNADLFIHRVTTSLQQNAGSVISTYRGNSALLMRVTCGGDAIRALLQLPEVSSIDRPPVPDWPDLPHSEITLENVPQMTDAPEDALVIGVVDSGLTTAHPFLAGSIIAAFGEPNSLGDSDEKGHGTPVSGIAAFGDLRQALSSPPVDAKFRIASARVVNGEGRFDDAQLVPVQMENAIRRLHSEYGCRVINVSLGDISRLVSDKPSSWAAALDTMARELNLVIVVSAGNASSAKLAAYGDRISDNYPKYLLEPWNRILEPASAVNVLTVGSIAHSNGLSAADEDNVGVRPIADIAQPSPFTRVGPGAGKVMKPDLVDFGGNAVFDGPTQALQHGANRSSAGILSTHHRYLQHLFNTSSGTSFAAPLVAHKAALLLESLPDASANLIRSLLCLCAEHPEAAVRCLGDDDDDLFNVLGYGICDVERALFSEDNRVILYAEDTVPADKFFVYEIPIPEVFQNKGERQIRVALAFDPPVRHTRFDYAGSKLSFRLIRGASSKDVFDAFRKWEAGEGEATIIGGAKQCDLKPGSQRRERGTLQCGTLTMRQDTGRYGNSYYLVVRHESGWSAADQKFAVAIEMRASADIPLYARIQERVRVRV
ncbi:S8 family peptidase [Rhodopseudomonas sp. HC1]|uniref:S8 family peptidase n=1 Tax=Rhodopseudomonas infernalis TaxID=2897386 RepID=UPI001EE9ACE0|nr:S8 family peptidase [Rhodopseudomonas infernalis]MCG6205351.1 S8 family peptidase [Rhodopseudomonas infernalis]